MHRLQGFLRFIPVLLTSCLIVGYQSTLPIARADVQQQATALPADVSTLVADITEFAFNLYHEVASEQNSNLIFSPYSISQAFAMLYAGAKGDTAAQMAEILNYNLPPEQLHTAFNALNQ